MNKQTGCASRPFIFSWTFILLISLSPASSAYAASRADLSRRRRWRIVAVRGERWWSLRSRNQCPRSPLVMGSITMSPFGDYSLPPAAPSAHTADTVGTGGWWEVNPCASDFATSRSESDFNRAASCRTASRAFAHASIDVNSA